MPQIGWSLRVLICLSLTIFILIVQPYKKSYMSVLDGLLLALLGFLALMIVAFEFLLPSSSETLPLIFVIACGIPQLVLLLSVAYTQLKGKRISRYIAGKVSTSLKKIYNRNRADDEHSDADLLPHRLLDPSQYNRPLLSESEQEHDKSETLTVRGQVLPVYTYGSIS